MSELFISYASDDREIVKRLVEALERQGWTVWGKITGRGEEK